MSPTETLSKIKSVGQLDEEKFGAALQDDDPVSVGPVKKIIHAALDALRVSDGEW